ncbi:hypothetical protein ACOSQ3_004155 [Xanthoceras sorbifolium]
MDLRLLRSGSNDKLWKIGCFIARSMKSSICKVCRYKKRTLVVLIFLLEIISFMLDRFGGSQWGFHLTSLLMSALGFMITIYSSYITMIKTRITAVTRYGAEMQLIMLEVIISVSQLISTCYCFVRSLLGVKTNYIASVSPLVCAIISVVFAFKTKEETVDSYPDIDHNGEDIEALLLDINSQVVEAFDHIEVNIEALLLDTNPVITSNNPIDYVPSSADEIQLVPSILQLPWTSAQSDQLQLSSHVNDQIQLVSRILHLPWTSAQSDQLQPSTSSHVNDEIRLVSSILHLPSTSQQSHQLHNTSTIDSMLSNHVHEIQLVPSRFRKCFTSMQAHQLPNTKQGFNKDRKRLLAELLFLLDVIPLLMEDELEGSIWSFIFSPLLLSSLSCLMTIYMSFIKLRSSSAATKTSEAEKQLVVLEIVFSVLHFIMKSLGLKSSLNASFFLYFLSK